MTAQPAATAYADQLAADLRDRRCCDPFAPCVSCEAGRRVHGAARAVASIPTQRTKENR